MFCYQCEQTAGQVGCSRYGVCGKDPETAALQDLLIHAVKGICSLAHAIGKHGVTDGEIDRFTTDALFTTVTNVNFDVQRLEGMLRDAGRIMLKAQKLCEQACGTSSVPGNDAATWIPAKDLAGLITQGEGVSIRASLIKTGPDITGLQELLLYGIKGMAAYATHARILGYEDKRVYAFIHEALAYISGSKLDMQELLEKNLKCGEVNLLVLEMLDKANTGSYGHPSPCRVRITPRRGKAILVSGHDLKDLYELLKQTEGSGINIYTHGEMLPAHGYPELRKFSHLAGNYGGAWQDQCDEFERFPGAILMTTNCIQKPKESYKGRIFTSGLVAWPGVKHVSHSDFGPLIEAALEAPGFETDGEDKNIMAGFAHNAVLGAAGKVVEAVKKGEIRRFFLIGGCDGAAPGRNYYTDFARAVPDDCVILTLACGKYRFNKLEFGAVAGLPRLLDCGQCNDAYSAIKIAGALAEAFNCSVNDLPLSLVLSWYEQKAVCILLTLLHLGIRNIRLGPSLPAYVTPAVLKVLIDKFNIKPITTVERDMEAALAGE